MLVLIEMKKLAITFIFLLSVSFSFAQDINCEKFKEGWFEYGDIYPNTVMYRENGYQIEYDIVTKKWVIVKLKWLSDCKYTYYHVKTNDKELRRGKDLKVDVSIVNENETGYDYVARVYGMKKDLESSFYYLTMDVDEKIKSKIIKTLRKHSK